MKKHIAIATLFFAIPLQAQTNLSDLAGMAGCWERSDKAKGLLITEQWMKPAGTSILGIGRTVKNGVTTGFEYMRIEQTQDGIVFISKPKENPEETVFKLIRSTPGEFVFENAAHDFPQRVIYKIEGVKLTGRIEGKISGKEKAIDFPMTRAKCE
jgi:hypothetical protein